MSKQYPGGIISKTPVTPSGPYSNDTASGIWTLDQQAYWQKLGQWPTAGNNPVDPQFNYVTMLLHGDGTNGAQNNTFLDSSTNNFTITRNGNTTQGSFSPYGSNWSNFFGTAQHKLSTTGMTAFGSNFTLELWIFPTSFNDYNTIFDSRDTDITTTGFVLGLTSAAKVYFYTNTAFQITTTTALSLNTWTHIALVRSGSGSGNVKVYINGVADATTATYTTSFTNTAASIGDDWNTRGFLQYFGYLSNLRAVTSALYTSTFTPSTTPLTAISGTVLLTCQSNRFIDNSSSALVMTVTGTPSVQRFNPFGASTAYSTSVIGGSGYFNGSGDYLTVPDDAQFTLTTSDYTMEMWVYPTTFSAQNAPFSYGWSSSGGDRLIVFIQNTNATYQIYYNNASANFITTNTVKLNAWNHLALVRNGSNFNFYINGVSSASATNSFSYANSPYPIVIGGSWSGSTGNSFYTGYISDVRVCVGTAVYTSGFTPPTAPLTTANTPVLLCNFTNGAIFDNAMMNDLETVGNAQISTSVVKYGTGSMYFDGNGDNLAIPTSPNLNMGTGDFTVECWVYISSRTLNYPLIFGNNNGGYSAGAIALTNSNSDSGSYNDKFVLSVYDIVSPTLVASSTNSSNTWYHLAVVRNGTSLVMYRNGTSVASTTISSGAVFDWGKLGSRIGGGNWDGAQSYFNGYIDDLRITKGYARYTATFTPPTAAFFNYGPT